MTLALTLLVAIVGGTLCGLLAGRIYDHFAAPRSQPRHVHGHSMDVTKARADWLEGYEFALRNINDEAVQADLAAIVEFGVTASSPARCSPVELPTGSAPAPDHDKRGHLQGIATRATAIYDRERGRLSEESEGDLRDIWMAAQVAVMSHPPTATSGPVSPRDLSPVAVEELKTAIREQLPQLEAVAALYYTSGGANEPGRIMAEMVQEWTPVITTLFAEVERLTGIVAAVTALCDSDQEYAGIFRNSPMVLVSAVRARLAGGIPA